MKPALRVAVLLLLVALIAPVLASACPLCKEAASDADRPGATSVWRGMYWSILFMVAAPFAMVGTMIVMIRRARRQGVGASLPSQASGSKSPAGSTPLRLET